MSRILARGSLNVNICVNYLVTPRTNHATHYARRNVDNSASIIHVLNHALTLVHLVWSLARGHVLTKHVQYCAVQ